MKKLGLVVENTVFSAEDQNQLVVSKSGGDAALWPSCWARLRSVIVGGSTGSLCLPLEVGASYGSDYDANITSQLAGVGETGDTEDEAENEVEDFDDGSSDEDGDDYDEYMAQFEFLGMSSRGLWLRGGLGI